MKIIYEPHPVTPARKAELRAEGYKIIDAVFKPADGLDGPVVGADAAKPAAAAVEPLKSPWTASPGGGLSYAADHRKRHGRCGR